MREEESEFSSLKTVSSFDNGDTVAVDVASQDLQTFSPSSLFVESLIEQLCNLLENDPSNRKNLYMTICEKLHQMNLIGESYVRDEFQFMRTRYQQALYNLLAVAKTTNTDSRVIVPKLFSQSPNNFIDCSRYHAEFHELSYIAHGGFGQVFKVQHKLDGSFYAIKKIHLRYQSVPDFLQNLREVRMLAKLNHPNIVAYKAAWLEPIPDKKVTKQLALKEPEKPESVEDSLEVVFENSSNIQASENMSSKVQSSSSSSTNGVVCEYKESSYKFSFKSNARYQYAILYIQMQLCQKTLRQWLDERNNTNPIVEINKCNNIFKKIVRGVEYIHSQGIVHHDIKPSNIFVSDDLQQVQVGDFGLACCLLTHQPPSTLPVVATHRPGQVGTELYAAPEQLEGMCDPKSDIFSLGIVLFELVQPFKTAMERSKMISALKAGRITTQIKESYPFLAKIISRSVNKLEKRVTAAELSRYLKQSEDEFIQTVITSQENIIRTLRQESLEKDNEITFLKKQLEELKMQMLPK